jgi:hypothetical protein
VLVIVVVGLLLVLGLLAFSRAQALFRIEVRDGHPRVARGYVPAGLLNDFGSALRGVKHGEIRAYKAEGGAQLAFSGDIDDGAAQRLRNIFGLYPIARLTSQHIDKRQVVNDAFTVAWLVSLFRGLFR